MYSCFFFNDTATTEIYTLSLHDALPISGCVPQDGDRLLALDELVGLDAEVLEGACKLLPKLPNLILAAVSSRRSEEHTSELRHANISYAVFCLKKKKTTASLSW